MRSLLAAALFAAPLSASLAAPADALNYNFLEFGAARAEQYGDPLEGFALRGSLAFGERWYGFIDMNQTEFKDGRSIDLVTLTPRTLGVGLRVPVGDMTDLVFEGGYFGVGSELFGVDYHNDGVRLAAGVRSRLATHFEIEVKATGTAVEEMDSVVGLYAGALVPFNENWAASVGYHLNAYDFSVLVDGGEVDVAHLGIRFSY